MAKPILHPPTPHFHVHPSRSFEEGAFPAQNGASLRFTQDTLFVRHLILRLFLASTLKSSPGHKISNIHICTKDQVLSLNSYICLQADVFS
jgi:hypothetical protein